MILSVDYEVFGDGSGMLCSCVTRPAERILSVAERHGAAVTFFVEALALLEMERAGVPGVKEVEIQLRRALRDGHDVQLHIHPQWDGAVRGADGAWQVRMDRWRLADLDAAHIARLMVDGKGWLERSMRQEVPDYRCRFFRAGAWCIQPSASVLKVARSLGLEADSTVAPGLSNPARGDGYDFRDVPQRGWWRVSDSVRCESREGLLEAPIAVGRLKARGRLRSILSSRLRPESGFAAGCKGTYRGPNGTWQSLRSKVRRLQEIQTSMLDFSTVPGTQLIEIARDWIGTHSDCEQLPVIAIAHTKNFTQRSEEALDDLLVWASAEDDLRFSSSVVWLDAVASV